MRLDSWKQPTDPGKNRTGVAMSPADAARLEEAARRTEPPPGDERAIAEVRQAYQSEAEPVGTVPPPATMRGVTKTVLKLLEGERPTVFLDKLGERCACERTGVRLYQLLVSRFEVFGERDVGPTLAQLRAHLGEEASHFDLLVRAIEAMGADPPAMTPCADTTAVMAAGVMTVLSDPRTSPAQCLQAALVAELTDRDGWDLLVDLAEGLGLHEMADEFERALAEEERHLARVRRWLDELTRAQARVQPPAHPRDPLQVLREQRRRLDTLAAELGGRSDGEEAAIIELASALHDEAEQLQAVGQELIARQTAQPT